MDLKALWKTTENLAQNRENKAETLTFEGFKHIKQAESAEDMDREALKEASACFIQSLRQNPHQAAPHIGLAYLFLLVSDQDAAQARLQAALSYEPENTDAQRMLGYIQNSQRPQRAAPPKDVDFDSLFDQVVTEVESELKIQEKRATPQLSLKPQTLKTFEKRRDALQSFLDKLSGDLSLLEHEFNIEELEALIKPLKIAYYQYQTVLKVSSQFQTLAAEMHDLSQAIKNGILQLSDPKLNLKNLETVELEQFLDGKEQMLLQLQQFQESGYDTQLLNADYQILEALLENFIDQLDGI